MEQTVGYSIKEERDYLLSKSPLVDLVDGDGRLVKVKQWLLEMQVPFLRNLIRLRSEQVPIPSEPISVPLNSAEFDYVLRYLEERNLRPDGGYSGLTLRICWVLGHYYGARVLYSDLSLPGTGSPTEIEALKMMCATGYDFAQFVLEKSGPGWWADSAFFEMLVLKISAEMKNIEELRHAAKTLAEDENLYQYLVAREQEISLIISGMHVRIAAEKRKAEENRVVADENFRKFMRMLSADCRRCGLSSLGDSPTATSFVCKRCNAYNTY